MILYHGSAYNHHTLKSGYERSGVLKKWDVTESNEFLYATTSKEDAIQMGFCSMLEQNGFLIKNFSSNSLNIVVKSKPLITLDAIKNGILKGKYVYLYELSSSRFVKNFNEYNNMETEYKTQSTIPAREIINKETYSVEKLMSRYHIIFT